MNAHLTLKLWLNGKVDKFTCCRKMKQLLNKMSTFSDFLYAFGENWEPKTSSNDKIDDHEESPDNDIIYDHEETLDTVIHTFLVPKRNRID